MAGDGSWITTAVDVFSSVGTVGAFAVGTFIFYGVVDWIVAVKNDRAYERQAQSEANGPRKPFVPRDLQGTQLNY